MTEQPPALAPEALIQSVPILIGRMDATGLVLETEGSLPQAQTLGKIIPGKTMLANLLPDSEQDIQAALAGRTVRFNVKIEDEAGLAHFEVRLVFDRRHGSGAYFLIHDVTETYQLHVALLDCTDREQIRIGQELHDTLGQELTAIAYHLHAASGKMAPGLAKNMAVLQGRISACLKHARDIAFKLSPHIEGEMSPAFERLSAHIADAFQVECVFTSQLEQPITDQGVAFNLFRIAQEACTNAVRHAAPRRIGIHLVTGAESRLDIVDDGAGLESSRISDFPGLGIPTMKFRAAAIGGSLRLSSRKPAGTLVRCHFENKYSPEAQMPSDEKPCETCS